MLLAVPTVEDLFSNSLITSLINFFSEEKMNFYADSFVVRHQINNIPPKFIPSSTGPTFLKELLNIYSSGVLDMYPIEMLGYNPQAKRGLAQTLRNFMNCSGVGRTPGYTGLLMDASLYWSTYKLMQSVPKLLEFRNETFLTLGHSYNLFF